MPIERVRAFINRAAAVVRVDPSAGRDFGRCESDWDAALYDSLPGGDWAEGNLVTLSDWLHHANRSSLWRTKYFDRTPFYIGERYRDVILRMKMQGTRDARFD